MIFQKNMRQNAFTLAEVLITLAIIGVIAAISVPSLIQKTNSAELKVAYKKAYAVASQAYDKASYDGLMIPRTAWNDNDNNMKNFNIFKTYFKVIKDCKNSDNANCWDNTGEKYFGTLPSSTAPSFIDSSGVAWSKNGVAGTGDELLIDTNGFKGPNKLGKDRWVFSPQMTNGSTIGVPDTLSIPPDCISTTDCEFMTSSGQTDYKQVCPSPPCYYTSWIAGKN